MKEIKLLFYRTDPSHANLGMKQVLYKITTDKGEVAYDFGYCDWLGTEWDLASMLQCVPQNFSIEVHSWANNPDPKHLINDSKIIKLHG